MTAKKIQNCSKRAIKDTKMCFYGYKINDISLVKDKNKDGGFIAVSCGESVGGKG